MKAGPPGEVRHGLLMDLLTNLDRRLIFLMIALSVALPLLLPLNLPVLVTREARAFYEEIERLSAGDVILLSIDYEPDTMAELDPMTVATLEHAFRKSLRVLALTTYAGGVGIAERILGEAARTHARRYGEDYVFLGYNPDWSATILRMGESIRRTYPTDHYRTPSDQIPLLRTVDSYEDVDLLVTIAASALAEYWVIWAGGKYHERVIAGNTAIQAVLIYPYFQAGQLSGFLGGLKGAAEYERLIGKEGAGVRGMDAQSMAHLLIVCLIGLGNIGFLLARRRSKQDGRASDSPPTGGA